MDYLSPKPRLPNKLSAISPPLRDSFALGGKGKPSAIVSTISASEIGKGV